MNDYKKAFEENRVALGITTNFVLLIEDEYKEENRKRGEGFAWKYKFYLEPSKKPTDIIPQIIRIYPKFTMERYTYENKIEGFSVYTPEEKLILSVAECKDGNISIILHLPYTSELELYSLLEKAQEWCAKSRNG